jgi:hypothetical protein
MGKGKKEEIGNVDGYIIKKYHKTIRFFEQIEKSLVSVSEKI